MILFDQYLEISLRSSRKTGTDMGLEVWPTESGSVTSEIILPKPSLVSAAAKLLQSCPTLRPHRRQPTRLPCPWDSPGKNTGVGCHFLLQCMKLKSESEVAQLCLTLSDPMDCSLPGSAIHGIFQASVLEWGAIAFSVLCLSALHKIPHSRAGLRANVFSCSDHPFPCLPTSFSQYSYFCE